MTVTARAIVRGGKLILDHPVDLPDGTEVEIKVRTSGAGPGQKASTRIGKKNGAGKKLSAAQLSRFAAKHPAPARWWNSKDDPFKS